MSTLWRNLQQNYRCDRRWLIAAAALLVVAAVILLMTAGHPPGAVAMGLDATRSTGDDYVNYYLPLASQFTGQLSGGKVLVERFGAQQDTLYEGLLDGDTALALRRGLMASSHMPDTVPGSFITSEGLRLARWLNSQRGGRKAIVLMTDGIEQRVGEMPLPASRWAAGIDAVVLFPRMATPRAAEALRLCGARVRVVRTPAEATEVLLDLATGTVAWQRTLRLPGWLLLALGGLFLPLAVRRQERPASVERPQTEPEVVEPVTVSPNGAETGLAPLQVEVTAQVEGEPAIRTRQRMRCTDEAGGLIVAREGGHHADLALPFRVLGNGTEVMVEIRPLSLTRLRVANLGAEPIVAGERAVHRGETVEHFVGDPIMLGPRARLAVNVVPTSPGEE